MIGRVLSTYRILERLGAGGMGEVYRARDEKLERNVAVKVLPPGLLGDETARSRFRREAKALSRLSHPHVATLLDFGSADGVDYLVMELVPGPTLDVALREGPLSAKEVVRLGTQLARGLAAAHEQGIVHRDLKPSNLCLTADGLLKILDFGLARLAPPPSAEGTQATPTETAAGRVVGSPPYMSPERLMGKEADPRSDVYSTGACLYELATGRRPYGDKSGALLVDAILHEAPEPAGRVRVGIPAGLESVIAKAMDKDPGLRYQTAKDLLVDLERLQQGTQAPGGAREAPPRAEDLASSRRAWRWAPWALAAAALAGLLVWLSWPQAVPRITAVRALIPDLGRTNVFDFRSGSWASDGKAVYYVAPSGEGGDYSVGIFRAPIEGGDPARVPLPFQYSVEIHGYVPAESALLVGGTTEPSPDRMPDGLPLWLVPVPFGAPRRIPNLVAWGADLAPDGRTLALTDIAGSGPEVRHRLVLAGLDGAWQRSLGPLPRGAARVRWTPDGRRLRSSTGGLASGGWENQIWEIPVEGGPPRPLGPGTGGAWTADGRYFLFEHQGGGEGQFDVFVRHESRWPPRLGGATQRLTVGPLSFSQAGPGPDGRRLFAYGHLGRGELKRFDPVTKTYTSMLGGESALDAEPSPDGKLLAWVRYPEGTLWKGRPDGGERLRLTSPPLEAHLPRWSPDGQRLAFAGRSPSQPQLSIHVVASDGSKSDVVARPPLGSDHYWDPCWMPDGTLVFGLMDSSGDGGLLQVDVDRGASRTIPGSEGLVWPKCSRQGDLLAAAVDRSTFHFKVRRRGASSWDDLGPSGLVYPNWTRDSRAFCGYEFAHRRIACFSMASRELTGIADDPPFPLLGWWLGNPWMGLDVDDRPLVSADRSTTGFYTLDWEAP